MPPKDQPRVSEEDQEIIRAWIQAGAPPWAQAAVNREYVSEYETQDAIRNHLRSLPPSAREFQRYFTFAHLANNRLVSNDELALYKAALSKLLNSLSWESEIVIPQPVDPKQTVYVIDLRDLDWTHDDHWSKVFKRDLTADARRLGYSYGLGYDNDTTLSPIGLEIRDLSGLHLAKLRVRADWFIAKASRPPLYHELLELPATADALEDRLEVTTQADWETPDLMRGAVKRSKISFSNRVLDRHRGLHGAYWVSYDFERNDNEKDLSKRPLGPSFSGHPFPEFAFVHDGGEILFSLPNGLNGYFLVNGEKQRINVGPSNIVADVNKFSGTTEVVTGISCIGCHRHGVVRFTDEIRAGFQGRGLATEKVNDLFAPPERLDARLRQDEEKFLAALLKTVQPFLPVSSIADLRLYPHEPVGECARRYHADLTLADAAAELDFQDPQNLRQKIEANAEMRNLLSDLLQDKGVVKRGAWEARSRGGNSQFQEVAVELKSAVVVD
jgi:serine/threonine-protein kinase